MHSDPFRFSFTESELLNYKRSAFFAGFFFCRDNCQIIADRAEKLPQNVYLGGAFSLRNGNGDGRRGQHEIIPWVAHSHHLEISYAEKRKPPDKRAACKEGKRKRIYDVESCFTGSCCSSAARRHGIPSTPPGCDAVFCFIGTNIPYRCVQTIAI